MYSPSTHYYGAKFLTHYSGLAVGPHGLAALWLLLSVMAAIAAAAIAVRWRASLARQ